MARYSIEGTTLSNIADAIRNKTNKTELIQVADMANEISNINGGNTEIEDAFLMRTLSGDYSNHRVTKI